MIFNVSTKLQIAEMVLFSVANNNFYVYNKHMLSAKSRSSKFEFIEQFMTVALYRSALLIHDVDGHEEKKGRYNASVSRSAFYNRPGGYGYFV